MTDAAAHTPPLETIRSEYLEQVRRRRLYTGLALLIFVVLMVAGFNVSDARNAGGFWDGLHNIGDYPYDVLSEAWEKRRDLPGLLVKYVPALIETINIAAVSTLVGAAAGLILSLLSTRGLAYWPRLIPLFRRLMDILRAIPEIVIALVLIFVLGGGPVPAMIAISLHTAGALGKMFSEVAENADLKPVEGLASTGATWTQRMLLGELAAQVFESGTQMPPLADSVLSEFNINRQLAFRYFQTALYQKETEDEASLKLADFMYYGSSGLVDYKQAL